MTNGNGKENKIVNSVKVIEIRVHKFADETEKMEMVAHEFMMVDHKKYLIDLLCEAIQVVMRTTKRKGVSNRIKLATMNTLHRLANKRGKGAYGRKPDVNGVEPIEG